MTNSERLQERSRKTRYLSFVIRTSFRRVRRVYKGILDCLPIPATFLCAEPQTDIDC
jgi:hypothetical protein